MALTAVTDQTVKDATCVVQMVHTAVARTAVALLATDPRITPSGALTAMVKYGTARLIEQRPDVAAEYRRALGILGIRIGERQMTFERFMSFVDPEVRLRLHGDHKVAGSA